MGFDPVTGVIVVLVIAFVVLGFIFLGRRAVKSPAPDEGVNASQQMTPHEPGHAGRNEPSDKENTPTAI